MTNTTIETTDYMHQTGNPMRSLKTITTDDHDDWSAEALKTEHAYEVAKVEAKGRIAEIGPNAQALAEILESAEADLEMATDMEGYQATYEKITADLEAALYPPGTGDDCGE